MLDWRQRRHGCCDTVEGKGQCRWASSSNELALTSGRGHRWRSATRRVLASQGGWEWNCLVSHAPPIGIPGVMAEIQTGVKSLQSRTRLPTPARQPSRPSNHSSPVIKHCFLAESYLATVCSPLLQARRFFPTKNPGQQRKNPTHPSPSMKLFIIALAAAHIFHAAVATPVSQTETRSFAHHHEGKGTVKTGSSNSTDSNGPVQTRCCNDSCTVCPIGLYCQDYLCSSPEVRSCGYMESL